LNIILLLLSAVETHSLLISLGIHQVRNKEKVADSSFLYNKRPATDALRYQLISHF